LKNNFALIGAAGYIAPRHFKAIKDTGNTLLAAYDPADNVGIIDNYFPEADFFTEFERFDRHVHLLEREGKKVDYVTVCSPNYLHDSHVRFGLRAGADVICEKPLVLNPRNAEALIEIEKSTNRKINCILQLRLHPDVIALKQKVENCPKEFYDVELTYITSRGNWYFASWKGDEEQSGGIATNIGIHFFDMLQWIFGEVQANIVHVHTHDRAAGLIEFNYAKVRWFLSVNADTLPASVKKQGQTTYRHITVNNTETDFSDGFTDLHTKSYEQILLGNGFSVSDCIPSIQITHDIRKATDVGVIGAYHPLAKSPLAPHPFSRKS
jgi:UDP-N-acetyl-2-amino-2-deoxyglucuronate dehydrogenase